jgi:hypothetical protein
MRDAKESLLDQLDEAAFHRWFGEADFSDDEKAIIVPTKFQAEWIENNFAVELATAFGKMPKILVRKKKHTDALVVQLPLWPEPARGTPNSFLRSALFAAIQGKGRRFLKNALLGAQKGYSVKFTGQQLDQSDLDVWEHAVHLARSHPLGNVCCFRANAFLKAIGRSNGKKDYIWLNESLTRLVACAVEIRHGSKVFVGSLLSSAPRDEQTGIYKLRLDPDTVKLYGSADWTGLQWREREALKGKPLALWLHGFFSSHAAPYPLKVETLRELSGSTNKDTRDFKRRLKSAFADLEAVAGIKATFDGDLVSVARIPSPSQLSHLTLKRRHARP